MSEQSVSSIPVSTNAMKVQPHTDTQNCYNNLSLEDFTKDGFKAITEAIRHANALPTERDWDFYKLNESFCKIINNEGEKLMRQMNFILRKYEIEDNIRTRGLDEKTELLVEANDTILERVGDNIDEMNGIKKKNVAPVEYQTVSAQLPINGSWNCITKATFSVSSSINSLASCQRTTQAIHLLTGKNIIRPQKFFKDKIDNSNRCPWQPRIIEKPNSIKPLALYIEESDVGETFCHPYEIELDQFKPTTEQLKPITPIKPLPVSDTPLHEISTQESLNELLEELRQHTEFAVDLEHHSYRTFMGITCLMQISTSRADYLIDTLELRDKLYILNEVFTKPSILKIFHGADSDIPWLQRDLSLYVVNMFDTHQAAKQLGYSGLSLAYLLNRFCKFLPNKQFQLADWRIRPLPEELKNYAIEDTHYLIYIYHLLKNELIRQGNGTDNLLKSVIQRSTEICKKRYYKPILREDSHLDFYRKCKRLFDNRQMYALRELYQWRDNISREEDESTGYVLPNHMLLQISEMLPREMQGILACCNPIPPLVRSNLLELHQIILRARDQSVEKPIMKEDNRDRGSTQQFSKLNIDSPLHCPHDLTKQQEFRDDLPTLLKSKEDKMEEKTFSLPLISAVKEEVKIEKSKAKITLFDDLNGYDNVENEGITKTNNLKFLGPYERYKLVKPYIQVEEEKAAAIQAAVKSGKEAEVDDRSNEDRIASLHEHFLKVAKATPQKIPIATSVIPEHIDETPIYDRLPSKSLLSMGGSKKRKRNETEDEVDYHPSYEIPENQLHTPVPKFNKKRYTKRHNSYNKTYNHDQSAESFGSTNYMLNESNNWSDQRNINSSKKKRFTNQGKRQKKNKNNSNPNSASRNQNTMNNSNPNSANRNQNTMLQQVTSSSSSFAPFDYSAVDFRQFQGGAGNANNNTSVESKFKAKNKNRMQSSRANNRYLTFKHRKGRGGY